MKWKLSVAFGLLAAAVALSLFALGERAAADGVYDPTNYEGSVFYPAGPCNDGYDNDGDQAIDAADPDCYDPPKAPPRTDTPTATATPTATNTVAPAATNTPQPPALGGVAQYPGFSSGGGNHLALAAVGLATIAGVVGAAWCARQRFAR